MISVTEYPITTFGSVFTIGMRSGDVMLQARLNDENEPVIYAKTDDSQPSEDRRFMAVATGELPLVTGLINEYAQFIHLGSFRTEIDEEAVTLHVFEAQG